MRNHLGNVKWPFKIGARLIQVAASTGGTVVQYITFSTVALYLKKIQEFL